MGIAEILITAGVVAILASVAGGGLKGFGVEVPLLASVRRQAALLIVGGALLGLGLYTARPGEAGKAGPVSQQADTAGAVMNNAAAESPVGPVDKTALPEPPAQSPGTAIPPISGLQFIAAREVILRSGWLPIGQGNPMHNENVQSGNGPMFLEKGYHEVVACAGTGLAECLFAYRSASGQVLHVTTAGEGETASVQDARIVDCAADPEPRGC